MAIISPDDIRKLAALARLPLDEAQILSYGEDIEEILEYVAKLSRVDTSAVPPVHGGGSGTNAFRTDEPVPPPDARTKALVAAFPSAGGGMAKVPPIIGRK